MAKYRKVSPVIWNDAKFRTLSDDAKLIFFMLLTHPQTGSIGTLRAYPEGLARELKWSLERFAKGFGEGLEKGMIRVDEEAGLIWLPNFIKHNMPDNPNVLKSWAASFGECPECPLKNVIFQAVKRLAEGLGKGFLKGFTEGFAEHLSNGMPNQEQEQEQDLNTYSINISNNITSAPAHTHTREGEFFGGGEDASQTPGIEFTELRDWYSKNVRSEGELTGWVEYKQAKAAHDWPGVNRIIDDLSQRIAAGEIRRGYGVSLRRYIAERFWLAPVSQHPRPVPRRASSTSGETLFERNLATVRQVMGEVMGEMGGEA